MMKHATHWILLLPLSGCLASFNPFNEEDFLSDFQDGICLLYLDCTDGVLNSVSNSDTVEQDLQDCQEWTATPSKLGCTISDERAEQCYNEMLAFQNTVRNQGECELLWADNVLASCRATYLNCETDRVFGTLPQIQFDPPEINSVLPLNGISREGNEVVIQGSGFDEDTQVFFSGTLATIDERSDTELKVRTPSLSTGEIPVRVTNKHGEADEEFVYMVWNDLEGQIGLNGSVGIHEVVGVLETMDSPFNGYNSSGGIQFLDQSNIGPGFVFPQSFIGSSFDSCLSNSSGKPVSFNLLPTIHSGGTLTGGGETYELDNNTEGGFYHLVNIEAQLTKELKYDVTLNGGGEAWPDILVDGSVYIPQQPVLTRPQIDALSAPVVNPGGIDLKWSPTATGVDYVVAVLGDPFTLEMLEACFIEDDGEFTMPPMASSTLPAVLQFCRVWEEPSSVSFNNGISGIAGLNCVVGLIK
jgi:hypothetical protein